MCSFETARTEKGGPPFHIHQHQDEWFLLWKENTKSKLEKKHSIVRQVIQFVLLGKCHMDLQKLVRARQK